MQADRLLNVVYLMVIRGLEPDERAKFDRSLTTKTPLDADEPEDPDAPPSWWIEDEHEALMAHKAEMAKYGVVT